MANPVPTSLPGRYEAAKTALRILEKRIDAALAIAAFSLEDGVDKDELIKMLEGQYDHTL